MTLLMLIPIKKLDGRFIVFSIRLCYFIGCFITGDSLSLFLMKRRDCGILVTRETTTYDGELYCV